MKLFKRVVEVSEKSGEVNTVQLAREARRDYVLAYARIGKPESAKDEFAKKFGGPLGLKMLEQYGKLLFDTGRDPEAQLVHRQLLAIHGDAPAAVLDQTRLLVLAQRHESVIQVRAVVLIALLAIVRKLIILDLSTTDALHVFALAAAVLALGAIYWVVRDQDRRGAR